MFLIYTLLAFLTVFILNNVGESPFRSEVKYYKVLILVFFHHTCCVILIVLLIQCIRI